MMLLTYETHQDSKQVTSGVERQIQIGLKQLGGNKSVQTLLGVTLVTEGYQVIYN
jgi:hypothetical protein